MNIRKIILLSCIAAVLLIAGLVAYSLVPKAYITFTTAPGQVSVSIDHGSKKTITNGDKVKVSPGKHTIVVSRDEFDPYEKEITLKNGQTEEFLVALSPLTDAARALLKDTASQAIIQRFYGKTFSKQTSDITKNYPLVAALPIQARLYTVYACPSQKYPADASKIAICVDLYHDSLEPYVLKDIQSRGYNPADYEIIWRIKYASGE